MNWKFVHPTKAGHFTRSVWWVETSSLRAFPVSWLVTHVILRYIVSHCVTLLTPDAPASPPARDTWRRSSSSSRGPRRRRWRGCWAAPGGRGASARQSLLPSSSWCGLWTIAVQLFIIKAPLVTGWWFQWQCCLLPTDWPVSSASVQPPVPGPPCIDCIDLPVLCPRPQPGNRSCRRD